MDEVPDSAILPRHVLVRPFYSTLSSGTGTASIRRDRLFSEMAGNPVIEQRGEAGPALLAHAIALVDLAALTELCGMIPSRETCRADSEGSVGTGVAPGAK